MKTNNQKDNHSIINKMILLAVVIDITLITILLIVMLVKISSLAPAVENKPIINEKETVTVVKKKTTPKIIELNCPSDYYAEPAMCKVEVIRKDVVGNDLPKISDEELLMYFDRYCNLSNKYRFTADDINYCIDKYLQGRSSALKDNGQAFIDASNKSGYCPIFLLAFAANEGGWESHELHTSKNNPYSINMTDSNPGGGYVLGDTYAEGIVNGAIWVRENYYNTGCCTLDDMIYKGGYASAKDEWINEILDIMNGCYSMLYYKN